MTANKRISEVQEMPVLRLTDFDMGGRGVPARLAAAIGKIPLEDERINHEVWGEICQDQARFPNGVVPVLNVDGYMICQSNAITRYLCQLAGLTPKTPLEMARVEEAVFDIEETVTG